MPLIFETGQLCDGHAVDSRRASWRCEYEGQRAKDRTMAGRLHESGFRAVVVVLTTCMCLCANRSPKNAKCQRTTENHV